MKSEMVVDLGFLMGITALVLAIPLGIASNLLTSRLVAYLEKRRLIKTHKTREQALHNYKRIKAFREGKRDKYPYYMLLVSLAVISAIVACTIVIAALVSSPTFEVTMILLSTAFLIAILSAVFLVGIYETARQLERFNDYKKEFEQRWGPIDDEAQDRSRGTL
jgi:ABC-type Co2+ transport system permease subunit